jgi:uncharacterized MAPEG superfamily protein
MPLELTALALSGIVHAAHFCLYAAYANIELTPNYTLGPRDLPPPRPLSVKTARLQRALTNSFEALILFTLAVVVVTQSQASSPLTQICASLFVGARILYIPAYWFGWRPFRSILWGVGFFASLIMIGAALI